MLLIVLGLVIHPATRILAVDRRRARVEHPRAESRIALFVVLATMVLGVFAFEVLAPFPFVPGTAVPELDLESALRILSAYAVASLPVWLVLAVRRSPLATVGISRRNLLRAILLGPVLGLGFAIVTLALDPASVPAMTEPKSWIALSVCLVVGFIEEATFRGYFQTRLSWAMGPVPALAVAAVVMALSPLPHYLVSQNLTPASAFQATGLMLVPSFLLGWFMTRIQNIAGPAILHAFIRWSLLVAFT